MTENIKKNWNEVDWDKLPKVNWDEMPISRTRSDMRGRTENSEGLKFYMEFDEDIRGRQNIFMLPEEIGCYIYQINNGLLDIRTNEQKEEDKKLIEAVLKNNR